MSQDDYTSETELSLSINAASIPTVYEQGSSHKVAKKGRHHKKYQALDDAAPSSLPPRSPVRGPSVDLDDEKLSCSFSMKKIPGNIEAIANIGTRWQLPTLWAALATKGSKFADIFGHVRAWGAFSVSEGVGAVGAGYRIFADPKNRGKHIATCFAKTCGCVGAAAVALATLDEKGNPKEVLIPAALFAMSFTVALVKGGYAWQTAKTPSEKTKAWMNIINSTCNLAAVGLGLKVFGIQGLTGEGAEENARKIIMLVLGTGVGSVTNLVETTIDFYDGYSQEKSKCLNVGNFVGKALALDDDLAMPSRSRLELDNFPPIDPPDDDEHSCCSLTNILGLIETTANLDTRWQLPTLWGALATNGSRFADIFGHVVAWGTFSICEGIGAVGAGYRMFADPAHRGEHFATFFAKTCGCIGAAAVALAGKDEKGDPKEVLIPAALFALSFTTALAKGGYALQNAKTPSERRDAWTNIINATCNLSVVGLGLENFGIQGLTGKGSEENARKIIMLVLGTGGDSITKLFADTMSYYHKHCQAKAGALEDLAYAQMPGAGAGAGAGAGVGSDDDLAGQSSSASILSSASSV